MSKRWIAALVCVLAATCEGQVLSDPPGERTGNGVTCRVTGGGVRLDAETDPPDPDRPASFAAALSSTAGSRLASVTLDPSDPDRPNRLRMAILGTTFDVLVTADPPGGVVGADPPGGLPWALTVQVVGRDGRVLATFADASSSSPLR